MSTPPPVDPSDTSAQDAYLDRLRAADPAAGSAPDLEALRAAVSARSAAESPGAPVDELATRRRTRAGWPARVAAAAAAALVVGTGGYAIGAGQAASTEQGAPVISLGGGSGQGTTSGSMPVGPAGPVGPAVGGGGAESAGVAGDATSMIDRWGGWWGRTVFTSSGLSTEPTRAQAWALDPTGVFSQETAAAAASALGLSGTPTLVYGAWQVGATDGTGPSLSLQPDGQGSLSYYDPTVDPWGCVTPDSGSRGEGGESLAPSEPVCSQRDLGPAPGGDAAAARLREVMAALGVDASAYDVVTEDYGDDQWSYVTAYQVVDGQRTGVAWSAAMTGGGLSSLYGALAPAVSLGEYDVVSPAEAVDRLGDPRFGASGGYPVVMEDTVAVPEGAQSDEIAPAPEPTEPTLPPVPGAGAAFSWPVQQVQITQARLGLAMTWQTDGSVVLVPTYELTDADGTAWSVIAVSDDALDFSTVG